MPRYLVTESRSIVVAAANESYATDEADHQFEVGGAQVNYDVQVEKLDDDPEE